MSEKNGGAAVAKKKPEPVTLDVLLTVEPTKLELLQELAAGNVTAVVAMQYLAKLEVKSYGKLSCKVSRKGAISVYGLNSRMPVTLYAEQWERFLEGCPDHFVLVFIREWEGKDYQGESATEKGGKKESYTARITRK